MTLYFDRILIEPGHGYFAKDNFQHGHRDGRYMEIDLIDEYIQGICEELDYEGIRWDLLPTRKSPGLSHEERLARIQPGMLVLSCHIGQETPKDIAPKSIVSYSSHPDSPKLAAQVAKAMADWGQGITWLHSSIIDKDRPIAGVLLSENVGIEIQPFAINSVRVSDYATKLSSLGKAIGKSVALYAKGVSPNLGPKPVQLREKPWYNQATQTR